MISGRARLHLDNLWRWKCGVSELPMPEDEPEVMLSLDKLRRSQWSETFERLMRNRLVMGSFRYGLLRRNSGAKFDSISSAIDRLQAYKDSGNQEHLVDAANLCLVEFVAESHPNAHMESIDDGEHVKEIR